MHCLQSEEYCCAPLNSTIHASMEATFELWGIRLYDWQGNMLRSSHIHIYLLHFLDSLPSAGHLARPRRGEEQHPLHNQAMCATWQRHTFKNAVSTQ